MSTRRRLENKVVIVTGATSGIGRAAAELFAVEGAAVIVAGRRAEQGEEVVAQIRAGFGEAAFVRTDVTNGASVEAMVAAAVRLYGRVDCAFNNAGIPGENVLRTNEHSEAGWDAVIATNLRGVWLCMKHELAHMRDRKRGVIVNTASIYAHSGSDFGIAPYVASKHGVLGLTRAAAIEFARDGVRVNAVSPGITRSEITTPALEAIPEEFNRQVDLNVPLGRIAEPIEIAHAALYLCSDDASYVTGEVLTVDGGWLAR